MPDLVMCVPNAILNMINITEAAVETTEAAKELEVQNYSPLTLCQDWPRVIRLLIMLFCCVYGSLLNGFFISSFFVEYPLRHVGNVFLSCAGVTDMLITGVIAPVAAVIILSGEEEWDNLIVCKSLQFVGLTANYGYLIYFMFVAVENYYRFCLPKSEYCIFVSTHVSILCVLIAVGSGIFAYAGSFYYMEYDYCRRKNYGSFSYRIASAVVLQIIPLAMTLIFLIIVFTKIKNRAKKDIQYRRSKTFEREYATSIMNLTAYCLHLLFWSPYPIIVFQYPFISDSVYYNIVMIGLSRSVITSTIYGLFHLNFRHAYAHLFNYCCCKNSLSDRPMSRHRRYMRSEPELAEIRVHIMHRAIAGSYHRAGPSGIQETFAL